MRVPTIRDRRISNLRAKAAFALWERRWICGGERVAAEEVRRYHRGMRRHARNVIAEQLEEMDESESA